MKRKAIEEPERTLTKIRCLFPHSNHSRNRPYHLLEPKMLKGRSEERNDFLEFGDRDGEGEMIDRHFAEVFVIRGWDWVGLNQVRSSTAAVVSECCVCFFGSSLFLR